MTGDEFDFLCKMLKDRSGLVLTRDKAYLLESRLLPVARKVNLKSVDELIAAVRARPSGDLVRDIVEAMTTNESFFFRDIKPFDQFKAFVLPALMRSRAARRQILIRGRAAAPVGAKAAVVGFELPAAHHFAQLSIGGRR